MSDKKSLNRFTSFAGISRVAGVALILGSICCPWAGSQVISGNTGGTEGLRHRIVKLSDYATAPYMARGAVMTAIELNPLLSVRQIDVIPMDRKLMLQGKVGSQAEKDLALYLARNFGNDLEIMDALEIDPSSSGDPGAASQSGPEMDGTRAAAVADATAAFGARAILAGTAYSGMNLDPDCQDGLLTLTGPMPTSGMRKTLSRSLSALPGVREVVFQDEETGRTALETQSSGEKKTFFNKISSKARNAWNDIRGKKDDSGNSQDSGAAAADQESEDWKDKMARKGKAAGEKMGKALRKTGKVVSDGWITTKISTAYAFNRHVNPLNVRVSTTHGEVELSGRARNQTEYEMAERIAQNVEGVVRIINRLVKDWEK